MRDIAFDDLKKIISERTRPVVFWTGAGVSAPAMPDWKELLNELVKVAINKAANITDNKALLSTIEFVKTEKDLWVSFERLYSIENGIGHESFRSTITRVLMPSNSCEVPLVHTLLWSLKPKGIVTLNLDFFTQRSSIAYSKDNITPIYILPNSFGQNASVFKESRPFIAYPHGYADNFDSWTFTSSTLAARLNDPQYVSWVSTLFASHTVVFIGLTADDVAVGGLLDRISKVNSISFRENFWITNRNDTNTDSWAETRGIRVIRYEAKDSDHSDLAVLLKEIADYKPIEDKSLETPLMKNSLTTSITSLPDPDSIDIRDKENLRNLLNGYALNLFFIYKNDEKKRDDEFRKFLNNYEDAVHNAYHTSVTEGRNSFLGYNLISRADGGAFGNVFRAIDREGNTVAIKVLHAEKLGDADFYRNFRRGVNSLKILTDRKVNGIVKFNDAVEIPPALIMEWIEGATLANAVHMPIFSEWRARLGLLSRLAEILLASHGLPERVLHRDLRPANIMLRDFYTEQDNYELVVLDFDLSWHRGAEDHSVMYSPAMGYLAPEQRRKIGKSSTRTALVDSYGFGMVMYYVISKKDPIPDMHCISSWVNDLHRETNSNYCPELRCVPRRIARLIYNCTLEEQSERTQMSQIYGELQSLIDYIDRPTELSSISILVEELAVRLDHMQGYQWNAQLSKAELHASAERRTSLAADIQNGNVILVIDWMNAGTQDWSQINRLLEKGFPKLVDGLKNAGWSTSQTKQARSFHIQGTISATEIVENLDHHAKLLDKAISYAFSMAG